MIYLLSIACSNQECYRSLDSITDEMSDCLIFLYIGAIFFFILAIYLHEIISQDPDENGLTKSPLFFLKYFSKNCIKRNNSDNVYNTIAEDLNSPGRQDEGDNDCLIERNFIEKFKGNYEEYPLICKGIRKVYHSKGGEPNKVAVKDFYLKVQKGEIFGLLGPSGAGKTTIISMLTGLYSPDKGEAFVSGANIKDDIEQVHLQIGVCQQFDKLWPDLTVEEHLLFYSRLKGVSSKEEKAKLEKALNEVNLEKYARSKAKELSGNLVPLKIDIWKHYLGGMKRRLSVAMALVGEPKIIFLDEPTTGLDPGNRKSLIDILIKLRGKRAMIITTHSMEEADILCSRIGKTYNLFILNFNSFN